MNTIITGIVGAWAVCSTAFAQELTLDDAIRIALTSNRSVKNAAIDAAKFDERKASLKSQFLPSARVFAFAAQPVAPFDFILGRGVLGVDSGQVPIPQSDVKLETPVRPIGVAAVTVTQPISAIPTIRKGLGLIDIEKRLADEQTRLERQTLVREVRQLYYGIQGLQSSLRAAQESVRLFQEVERITSQYVEKRQVLDVDYLDAQLHLAKAIESVLDLENQRETLKSKLNRQLGRAVQTEFTVPEITEAADASLPDALQDVSEAKLRALAQRPEARQAQLRIEQAKSEIRIASAGFNPSVAAEFTGIETTPVNSLLPRQVGIAAVGLTWEPFTWGRKKHELALRREELQETVNKEEDVKAQVEVDVAEQFRRLQLAIARLHVASLGRQMAAESLRVAQKQYEVQFSLLKTVLQAQALLESSDADYHRTLTELWTARAEYQRALGEEQ
jgi:outer membrane protein TolC